MSSFNKVDDDDLPSLLRDDLLSLLHHSPIDIASRLFGMLETENQSHYLRRSYLSRPPSSGAGRSMNHCQTKSSKHGSTINTRTDNRVTTETRSKVAGWLYECVEYLGKPRDCVEVAMGYVDRVVPLSNSNLNLNLLSTFTENETADYLNDVLSSAIFDATSYQLVALTSMYIATKLCRLSTKQESSKMQSSRIRSLKRSVEVRDFVNVSHGIYTTKEILDTERSILAKLDWRLNCPTSLTIAQHAIVLYCANNTGTTATASASSHAAMSSLVQSVTAMIERSVLNYDISTSALPSTIAYASILATLDPECRYGSLRESSFGRTLIMYGIADEFDISTSRMVDGVRAMVLIDTLKTNSRYIHERLLVGGSSIEGRRIGSPATTIRQVYNKVVEENISDKQSLERRSLSTSDSPINVSDFHLSYLDCNRFTDEKKGKKMKEKEVEKLKKFRRITVSSNTRYSSNNIDKIPSTIVLAPLDTHSTISSLSSISTLKARSSAIRRSIDP